MGLLEGIVNKKHILLLGIPRTGSTWMGKILSATMDYSYVHEPDNEKESFYGYYAKSDYPRFPILNAQQEAKSIEELFQMAFYQPYITPDSYSNRLLKRWAKIDANSVENELQDISTNRAKPSKLPYIFGHVLPKQLGNRNNRVVKTTHSILAADFILSKFENLQPLFIIRHPAAVVNSLLQTQNADIDRKLYLQESIITKHPEIQHVDFSKQTIEFLGGLQVGIFYSEIKRLQQKHPNSKLILFEDLVEDPFLFSYRLYEELGMKWNENVELFIANSNRLATAKETRQQSQAKATEWQKQLTEKQIEQIKFGYELIEGSDFYRPFF